MSNDNDMNGGLKIEDAGVKDGENAPAELKTDKTGDAESNDAFAMLKNAFKSLASPSKLTKDAKEYKSASPIPGDLAVTINNIYKREHFTNIFFKTALIIFMLVLCAIQLYYLNDFVSKSFFPEKPIDILSADVSVVEYELKRIELTSSFVKLYVGATFVEILGIVSVITISVFNNSSTKAMEKMLDYFKK